MTEAVQPFIDKWRASRRLFTRAGPLADFLVKGDLPTTLEARFASL